MGFWDKMEGAGKWITDPKQILTAAGFYFGGPKGAGVGRTIGGFVPDPWGERESHLEDGFQLGDLASAGQDFASGYTAGKVGQQVPGIRGLEGAFAGGAGVEAGQGMGVEALTRNNPNFMETPDFGSRMSSVGAPPRVGGVGAGVQTPFDPMASPHELVGLGGGAQPNFAGRTTEKALSFPDRTGGVPIEQLRPRVSGAPDPLAGAFGGQPGMGADALTRNNPGYMQTPNFGAAPQTQTAAQTVSAKNRIVSEVQQGKEGENWWGGMSGIERMYAINMMANLGSSMFAGPERISSEGVDMLGGMGLFSQAPQRQIPSFDEWRSQRGRYA